MLSPAGFVKILELAQDGLLPGGHPAPSVPDPSPEEQQALRVAAEAAISDLAPGARSLWRRPDRTDALLRILVPGEDEGRPDASLARDILDPWGSHAANCTTVLVLLDHVIGRLFPELLA